MKVVTCALYCASVFLLSGGASVQAQDAFVQGNNAEHAIKITECVVVSLRDSNIKQDCTALVAKACDGSGKCEVPMGLNLTNGRDIDPVGPAMARRIGKTVKVMYQCGKTDHRHGPNHQNDNATMVLECH